MKKTIPILLLYFVFTCQIIFSQSFTISGYVSDKSSDEKLINATIYNNMDYKGTISNEYGFYSLTLAAGNIDLRYSYIGYTTFISNFNLNKDTIINIALDPSAELQEVVVTEKNSEQFQERTQMSTIEIPIEQIKALPAFLGEVDVLKAMQLLPGVSGGTEGTSGIFVRGGSPDQNLILLDGVPVYNASHLFGFFFRV